METVLRTCTTLKTIKGGASSKRKAIHRPKILMISARCLSAAKKRLIYLQSTKKRTDTTAQKARPIMQKLPVSSVQLSWKLTNDWKVKGARKETTLVLKKKTWKLLKLRIAFS